MGMLSLEEYQIAKERYLELTKLLELPGALGNLRVASYNGRDFEEGDGGILVPKHEPEVVNLHEQPVMSFNRNWSNLLASQLLCVNSTGAATFGDGEINVKDQTGTIRGSTSYGPAWRGYLSINAAINNDTKGLVVGTGATAESFEDFAMDAIINDGTGSGELEYFAQNKPSKAWDGSGRTWTIIWERFFKNQDGSSITINEVGLIEYVYGTNLSYYILTLRDALTSGVSIASGNVARATIEMVTTAMPS